MRLVNLTDFDPTPDVPSWTSTVATALSVLQGMPDGDKPFQDRSEWIDAHPYWQNLIPFWRERSKRKCWYCESRVHRDDMQIDHFRPKNAVDQDPLHPGYWWSAYDWRNYRLSCRYCNLGRRHEVDRVLRGKGTRFPLLSRAIRALRVADEIHELPALLDPVVGSDVSQLKFLSDGKIEATNPNDQTCAKRVEVTIRLLHLDHPGLIEDRQELHNDLLDIVISIDNVLIEDRRTGIAFGQQALDRLFKQFERKIEHFRPHSGAAISYLLSWKSKYKWLPEILNEYGIAA